MTGEQPTGHVLTRRELRELRAKGGEAAVAEAMKAAEPVETPAPAAPRESQVVASTSEAQRAEVHPLTRREMRRLRTNEVPVVTADDADEQTKADGTDETPTRVVSVDDVARAEKADQKAQKAEKKAQKAAKPADEPKPAPAEKPKPGIRPTPLVAQRDADSDDEYDLPETVAIDQPVVDRPAGIPAPSENPAKTPSGHPQSLTLTGPIDGGPTLDPSFGRGVGSGGPRTTTTSFDALLDQYTPTSPSSILMTSSHRLPEGIGSTGAAKGAIDPREVDAVLVDGEIPASSSPTPIAASAAISTQKLPNAGIRPPAPEKGRGLVMALGITAGALGIVVVGGLVAAYYMGVFG